MSIGGVLVALAVIVVGLVVVVAKAAPARADQDQARIPETLCRHQYRGIYLSGPGPSHCRDVEHGEHGHRRLRAEAHEQGELTCATLTATCCHRDRVNTKAMKDKRLADTMDPKSMPFDVKRMVYGGFTVLVDV